MPRLKGYLGKENPPIMSGLYSHKDRDPAVFRHEIGQRAYLLAEEERRNGSWEISPRYQELLTFRDRNTSDKTEALDPTRHLNPHQFREYT